MKFRIMSYAGKYFIKYRWFYIWFSYCDYNKDVVYSDTIQGAELELKEFIENIKDPVLVKEITNES